MRRSILISYQAMMIGGSTTSLLGLLNTIDYNVFDVDLLLNSNTGELLGKLPAQVNLLPPAFKHPNHTIRKFFNLLSARYIYTYIKSKRISKESGNIMHGVQYLEMMDVIKFRKIEKEYDVAIAFLEGINCKFVANHIKAKRKIAWIHIDYKASGFNPVYDCDSMSLFDSIVTVSEKCKESFTECFPELEKKTCAIENIISDKHLRSMAEDPIKFDVDDNFINLVTTCRVEFKAKALDRAVSVFASKKTFISNKIRWYIIGDGIDFEKLKCLIDDYNLSETIILLGKKINPYPYLKKMSVFFLPSRFEGKPMSVTEGLILGLPAFVTEYSSAHDQVRHGIDGIVVENSERGISDGLDMLINNSNLISEWKANIRNTNYSNTDEIDKLSDLINK